MLFRYQTSNLKLELKWLVVSYCEPSSMRLLISWLSYSVPAFSRIKSCSISLAVAYSVSIDVNGDPLHWPADNCCCAACWWRHHHSPSPELSTSHNAGCWQTDKVAYLQQFRCHLSFEEGEWHEEIVLVDMLNQYRHRFAKPRVPAGRARGCTYFFCPDNQLNSRPCFYRFQYYH